MTKKCAMSVLSQPPPKAKQMNTLFPVATMKKNKHDKMTKRKL